MKDHETPLMLGQTGVDIRASYVHSRYCSEDFGTLRVALTGGIEFSVYPLTAEDCFTLAGKLESLGRALRQSEEDRARFIAAIAADEMKEAA